jgi:prolyl oligopeptidase
MRYVLLGLIVTTTFFGQTVADPYRWLEDANSPRTQLWIDAHNAQAERIIDAYSGNKRIAARIGALELTGAQQFDPQISGNTLFYMREVPPQPQPVLMAQPSSGGSPRLVVDPAAFGSAVSIDFYWPSPSGRYVAIGTAQGGAESTTIRVVSSIGDRKFTDALGPAGGGTTGPALAWDASDNGFTYARLPANGSQFGIKLYHHVLGTPQSQDALELGEVSPIAEPQLITSDDARSATALIDFGDGSFHRVYVRSGSTWKEVVRPEALSTAHFRATFLCSSRPRDLRAGESSRYSTVERCRRSFRSRTPGRFIRSIP